MSGINVFHYLVWLFMKMGTSGELLNQYCSINNRIQELLHQHFTVLDFALVIQTDRGRWAEIRWAFCSSVDAVSYWILNAHSDSNSWLPFHSHCHHVSIHRLQGKSSLYRGTGFTPYLWLSGLICHMSKLSEKSTFLLFQFMLVSEGCISTTLFPACTAVFPLEFGFTFEHGWEGCLHWYTGSRGGGRQPQKAATSNNFLQVRSA